MLHFKRGYTLPSGAVQKSKAFQAYHYQSNNFVLWSTNMFASQYVIDSNSTTKKNILIFLVLWIYYKLYFVIVVLWWRLTMTSLYNGTSVSKKLKKLLLVVFIHFRRHSFLVAFKFRIFSVLRDLEFPS